MCAGHDCSEYVNYALYVVCMYLTTMHLPVIWNLCGAGGSKKSSYSYLDTLMHYVQMMIGYPGLHRHRPKTTVIQVNSSMPLEVLRIT